MSSLKKEFAKGVLYTSLAKYSGIIVQIVVTAILARLLNPDDFGVIAVATIVINLFNTFSDAGLGPAIIQRKEFSEKDYNSVFTFSLVLGFVLMIVFLACSDIIGKYYVEDRLSNVCRWLSALVLLSSADVVPNSLLLKRKRFDIIAGRTLLVQFVVGLLSIYTAYIGWGIYALVLSAILSKALVFIFNYIMNPLKLNFHFSSLNSIKSYSFYQFLCNLMAYFARNLDKLVVGRVLGMNSLGFYEKSYKLMMLPLQNITFVITPVMQPLFSDYQNNLDLLMNKYLKLCSVLAFISFPLTAIVFFCSEELILLFFGDKWVSAILPFRILSLSIEIQILQSTCGAIFQSTNNTKGLFFSSLISLLIMIIGLYIAAIVFRDLQSVSWSFVITNFIGVTYVFFVLFKSFKRSIVELLRILKKPTLLMIIEFTILWLISFHVQNIILSLILKTTIWAAMTIALFFLFGVLKYNHLIYFIKSIRNRFF